MHEVFVNALKLAIQNEFPTKLKKITKINKYNRSNYLIKFGLNEMVLFGKT